VTTRTPELVALDPKDGKVTARLPLESIPLPPEEARLKHGVAAVVASEGGQVRLVAPGSLEVRWRRDLGQSITSPPLVTKDRIYLAAADRSIRALKLSSGRQKWAQRVGSRISARLFVRGEFLYALCYDTDIYLLGARNGHLKGRVHLDHRLAQDAALGEGRGHFVARSDERDRGLRSHVTCMPREIERDPFGPAHFPRHDHVNDARTSHGVTALSRRTPGSSLT